MNIDTIEWKRKAELFKTEKSIICICRPWKKILAFMYGRLGKKRKLVSTFIFWTKPSWVPIYRQAARSVVKISWIMKVHCYYDNQNYHLSMHGWGRFECICQEDDSNGNDSTVPFPAIKTVPAILVLLLLVMAAPFLPRTITRLPGIPLPWLRQSHC